MQKKRWRAVPEVLPGRGGGAGAQRQVPPLRSIKRLSTAASDVFVSLSTITSIKLLPAPCRRSHKARKHGGSELHNAIVLAHQLGQRIAWPLSGRTPDGEVQGLSTKQLAGQGGHMSCKQAGGEGLHNARALTLFCLLTGFLHPFCRQVMITSRCRSMRARRVVRFHQDAATPALDNGERAGRGAVDASARRRRGAASARAIVQRVCLTVAVRRGGWR